MNFKILGYRFQVAKAKPKEVEPKEVEQPEAKQINNFWGSVYSKTHWGYPPNE